jgi:endoglycosylceramidase
MLRWLPVTLVLLVAACDAGIPDPPPRPFPDPFRLPALHAEPDPEAGGRIVDALGREVILRGVNVNAHVEYWQADPARFTTFPLTSKDADRIAGIGSNVVRLLLSWSRVEPAPGVYDEAYLDEIAAAIRMLERRGIYSIVDLHQDAWGPTLAARPDEVCPAGSTPAFGWDGAPGWATLAPDSARRCVPNGGQREYSPAVVAAFVAFWNDAPAADGVGIRTRYVQMLAHVARRLAPLDAVAGWDLMNEPNAFFSYEADLAAFYEQALPELRAAEAAAGAPPRLVFIEPSIVWNLAPHPLPDFAHDDQIVYAPHMYIEPDQFPLFYQSAADDAALLGGAPVLIGEWGGDPRRAENPADDYFAEHQAFQDAWRFGATLWTWREACGDPHKAWDWRAGQIPYVWGEFDLDCTTGIVHGVRQALVDELRRPMVRAAPGRLVQLESDAAARTLAAAGEGAAPGTALVAFLPGEQPAPAVQSTGLAGCHTQATPGGGTWLICTATGGAWTLRVGS